MRGSGHDEEDTVIEAAAQVVDETSTAYALGGWTARVVMVLLVALLVRRYVFGRPSPTLRLRPRREAAAAPPVPPRAGLGPVLGRDILPERRPGRWRR